MKIKIYILSLIVVVFSCKKEEKEVVQVTPVVNNQIPANATVLYKSTFNAYNNYKAVGDITITQEGNNKYLYFASNFATSQGPDVNIMLSSDVSKPDEILLGKLISISGPQVYAIPNNTDLELFKNVLIYCSQANRLFGYAKY